jgi:predicted transcriptional regulator
MLNVGKTTDEIAVHLNRTNLAIYARLQRLYRKSAREARLVELGLKAKK